ncbi:ATP-dependent DNA helicase [Pseudoclavibacter sp. AY1F1]|uniref:ATP-dependent helicase n=1 Tax=Pseudoclavibacter sp. AY1F1 TaxID=2080583 RepID=UPI000CE8E5CA|nr:ATP-dependent DNA helicase [Pseudoclavibacter sp. AY1F1]PPF47008.1 ATP-dependent DNA helicase [Pseudoclavibacter sp. AY1F1]
MTHIWPAGAVTHGDIALALADNDPARMLEPTAEQRLVIEAPPVPSLVMAGAGSGKTQTMVQRIVWLVAAQGVHPTEILGLTFTRKAAGELRERVQLALARLRSEGLIGGDEFATPEVSTYNSFANRVFSENALLIGQEPDARIVDEMTAFALMRNVVLASDDSRLSSLDLQLSAITNLALNVARALRDNQLSTAACDAFVAEFRRVGDLPGRGKANSPSKPVVDAVAILDELPIFVALAERYQLEKRKRGLIEFSDQVTFAAEICAATPAVVEELRTRHRFVILDEYQDTSVGQTRLLGTIFSDHPVLAVGDPKQSIYGWRGASPGNMRRFHGDFRSRIVPPAQEPTFQLSISWRNDARILDAANQVASRLPEASDPGVTQLGTRPGAGDGRVSLAFAETLDEEAEAVATWMRERIVVEGERQPPSGAVLLRARKLLPLFSAALTRAGVPNRVIGLGGLLSAPEVVDLRCAMRVAHDSTAGNELIRLLVGAKYQFGIADVKLIHDVSRSLANRDVTMQSLADDVRASKRELATGDDEVPLQEALDFLAARITAERRRDEPDSWLMGLSEEALRRIPLVSQLIGELRRSVGLPITSFVDATISIMGLDLEVTANPGNIARVGNLDAFAEAAAAFASAEPDADLGAFLDWVEIAAGDDSLAPVQEQAEPGVVQLLSIHGSKGLEWDFVAVPRSVEGEMPSTSRDGLGWIRRGVIPYELLLDAHDRPELPWRGAETQKELADLMVELKQLIKERNDDEERRLAYVAYTRARHELLISGSYWSAIHKSARKVSVFVDELAEAGIIEAPPANTLESAPASLAADSIVWPHRPFSPDRLERVQGLAAAVDHALRSGAVPESQLGKRIDLLLRERADRGTLGGIQLPARFAASKFKDLVTDPAEIAAQLRRPMPQKPFRQTRIGTMFHAWVEAHYAAPNVGGDLLGMAELFGTEDAALSGLADASSADFAELERLQDAFLETPWPHRSPILVEQTIEFRLGERTVVCKIDAVFEHNGRVEVVDWKTGRVPSGESARWERQLQLALYTLAYSEHTGVPPEQIDAVLVYVREGEEIRVPEVTGRVELERLLAEAEAALSVANPSA